MLLDRRILEGLKGPLVHLARNAMDHGLETPEERDAAGKHREGALVIRVEQQGNLLFLEFSDDGRGIDVEKIRRAALQSADVLKRGICPGWRNLTSVTSCSTLVFHQGGSHQHFRTGRGWTWSKARSQAMKGTVEIQSKAGQGTRFIITLPIELGSSRIQIVRVGPHFFGLPLLFHPKHRPLPSGSPRIFPGGMEPSKRRLPHAPEGLQSSCASASPKSPNAGQPLLLMMASEGLELALAVDEIIGDENLVLHPLPLEFLQRGSLPGSRPPAQRRTDADPERPAGSAAWDPERQGSLPGAAKGLALWTTP